MNTAEGRIGLLLFLGCGGVVVWVSGGLGVAVVWG